MVCKLSARGFYPFFFMIEVTLSRLTPSISFASRFIKADPLSMFQLCSTSLNSSHLNFPLNNLRYRRPNPIACALSAHRIASTINDLPSKNKNLQIEISNADNTMISTHNIIVFCISKLTPTLVNKQKRQNTNTRSTEITIKDST